MVQFRSSQWLGWRSEPEGPFSHVPRLNAAQSESPLHQAPSRSVLIQSSLLTQFQDEADQQLKDVRTLIGFATGTAYVQAVLHCSEIIEQHLPPIG